MLGVVSATNKEAKTDYSRPTQQEGKKQRRNRPRALTYCIYVPTTSSTPGEESACYAGPLRFATVLPRSAVRPIWREQRFLERCPAAQKGDSLYQLSAEMESRGRCLRKSASPGFHHYSSPGDARRPIRGPAPVRGLESLPYRAFFPRFRQWRCCFPLLRCTAATCLPPVHTDATVAEARDGLRVICRAARRL